MFNADELLEKIEKGEPINWGKVAQKQPLLFLKIGQDYAEEMMQRSQQADLDMQRMVEDVEFTLGQPASQPE